VKSDGARVRKEGEEDEIVQIEALHEDPRVISDDSEVPHAGQTLARPVPLQTQIHTHILNTHVFLICLKAAGVISVMAIRQRFERRQSADACRGTLADCNYYWCANMHVS
jgi:hypothetical protein